MIIVAGHLRVDPAGRESYLDTCREVVALARVAPGCLDFSLTADLLDADRINIFERWATVAELADFRGSGTDGDQGAAILDADVREFYDDREVKL